MQEFTQSVKATLYDRAKKPFTGTFILAWIAYNWKILVAIFFINEEHLKDITRIEYIENLQLLGINNLVWKPFGIAVVALIALGILNIITSWIVLQFKNFQFTYVDKRTKVDSAEYGKLLDELKNIKDKWANEIQSINTERTDLIKSNDEYIADNDNLNSELNNLKKQSYDDQKTINEMKSSNQLYQNTLTKASELLADYTSKYGTIKKDRTIANTLNKAHKSKPINDIVIIINKQHDNYNS
ncbi:hypothetical protein [Flavivirga rizhaonensis]|uniref:Uncharacterized protein n=1 Tax=Flavivirga rizhaonensis TaxID=2559571 RepID=A0A4S1DWV4_9FLAO|nr:hypothetical protein [Flavivirga rizhaonensis]TGV02413.1 hypothetical protein EM932_10690 [Flavivirga rizhaonensis]